MATTNGRRTRCLDAVLIRTHRPTVRADCTYCGDRAVHQLATKPATRLIRTQCLVAVLRAEPTTAPSVVMAPPTCDEACDVGRSETCDPADCRTTTAPGLRRRHGQRPTKPATRPIRTRRPTAARTAPSVVTTMRQRLTRSAADPADPNAPAELPRRLHGFCGDARAAVDGGRGLRPCRPERAAWLTCAAND